jgi:VanZ family protein
MSPFRTLHLFAFLVPLGVFTYLLLTPEPPRVPTRFDWVSFLAAKGVHAGGYAYLAAVGFLFPRVPRYRWVVVGFMMLHGVTTETIQAAVPELHRHGCVQDVLIDWGGIAVGQFAARRSSRLWVREFRSDPGPTGSHFPSAGPE